MDNIVFNLRQELEKTYSAFELDGSEWKIHYSLIISLSLPEVSVHLVILIFGMLVIIVKAFS